MADATQDLVNRAREAATRAYAPYSGFHVGAALLGDSGRVFAGCNVENASYGLTMCAERTAVGCAIAAGETGFAAIAIYAAGDAPPAPCGACRQVLHEFGPRMKVILASGSGPRREMILADLLPEPFDRGCLSTAT